MPTPKARQLKLSEEDRELLAKRIRDDYADDTADHELRVQAMRRWYKQWRTTVPDPNAAPDQERPNSYVQLLQWVLLAKLSKEIDALLGEESEIMVKPIGESDVKRASKVKTWINWRVKNSLKLFKPLYNHLLQKGIFGTSIWYMAWATKMRTIKTLEKQTETIMQEIQDPASGLMIPVPIEIPKVVEVEKEVIDFDGPEVTIENIEDFIFPVNAQDIQTCDHLIRVMRIPMDTILDMLSEDKLDKKQLDDETLEKLRHYAETGNPEISESTNDALTEDRKAEDGLTAQPQGVDGRVRLHCWFGKFRKADAKLKDKSEEVVSFFSPQLNKLLGACRLVDIFPDGRRPFGLSQGILDVNKVHGIGLAELLEGIGNEINAIQRLAIAAGEGAVGPVIFYQPGAGFNPDKHRLEPYSAIPCADPNSVKVVNPGQIQLDAYITLMQMLLSFAERLTAITDPQLGRQSDRPNAPRTLGQQQIFQGESNVRLLLDIRLERENLREMISRIWEMDKRWLPDQVFFRVTEQDPGDTMTKEDMQGEYDFDLGPVNLVSNRQIKMQESLQALALSIQMKMPQAAIPLFKKLMSQLGHPDVAAQIPDISQMQPPARPEDENVRIMQGEDVDPHPMDNHAQHIAKHTEARDRIANTEIIPGQTFVNYNPGVVARFDAHIAEHQQAMKGGLMTQGSAPAMSSPNGGGGMAQIGGASPQEQANPMAGMTSQLLNVGSINQQ